MLPLVKKVGNRRAKPKYRRPGKTPNSAVVQRVRKKMSSENPDRLWGKIKADSLLSCWIWTGSVNADGYGCLPYGDSWGAHRAMWKAVVGNPGTLYVLHTCDNPPCVNPFHLFLGTQKHNVRDMFRKGRGNPPVGTRCSLSKLSEADVKLIRKVYAKQPSRRFGKGALSKLAEKFGVDCNTISSVARRETWKHIP